MEKGRVIVIPGVDSDGNVTLHYYPVDEQDAEPEPELVPAVDRRSTRQILRDLDRLCGIALGLEADLARMASFEHEVSRAPVVTIKKAHLLPGERSAAVKNLLRRSAPRRSTAQTARGTGVRQMVLGDGVVMEVPE